MMVVMVMVIEGVRKEQVLPLSCTQTHQNTRTALVKEVAHMHNQVRESVSKSYCVTGLAG